MRVLVNFERSGIVRDAFAELGHDAWSCDIVPSMRGGKHYQCDAREVLHLGWDLMIAHPPCTYLCSSGLHWNTRRPGRQELTEQSLDLVRDMFDAPIPRISLENPIGCISTRIRKPDQIIQPWQFGDDASKQTCLWLQSLPKLQATTIVPPKGWSTVKYATDCIPCECCGEPYCKECDCHYTDCDCIGPSQDEAQYAKVNGFLFARLSGTGRPVWSNQTASGQNKLGPSPERAMLRSLTYSGIARAMAEQWGVSA
jgi:hypothetical protein